MSHAYVTTLLVLVAVGAALIVLALRRQHLALVSVVAASLVVGFTMYDGGPLCIHLDAIAAAVVLLVASVVLFAEPPWRHRSVAPGAAAR